MPPTPQDYESINSRGIERQRHENPQWDYGLLVDISGDNGAPYTPRLGSILVSPSIADALETSGSVQSSGPEEEMACFPSWSPSKKRKRPDHTIVREDSKEMLVGDFPQHDSTRQCSDDSTSSIPDELQKGGGKLRHLAASRQGSPSKDSSLNTTVKPSEISLKNLSWAIEMARLSYLVYIVNHSGRDLVYQDSHRGYTVTRKGVPIKVRIIARGPSGREGRLVSRMAANDKLLEIEFRKNKDLAGFLKELNTQSRFKLTIHDSAYTNTIFETRSHDPQKYSQISLYNSHLSDTIQGSQAAITLGDSTCDLPRQEENSKAIGCEKPLIYLGEGKKKVTVDISDLERLNEGRMLNDNLINFYLRFLEQENEKQRPDVAQGIHLFNTYFFTSLTRTANSTKCFNYEGVKGWTKTVDLFSYKYVIIPINESCHWYVAIICNLPALDWKLAHPKDTPGSPADTEDIAAEDQDLVNTQCNEALLSSGEKKSRNFEPRILTEQDAEDSVEVLDDQPKPSITQSRKYSGPLAIDETDSNEPAIIVFDSLGLPHDHTIQILKDYLSAEARTKRGGIQFDITKIAGINAKVPKQDNCSDCGLFLLGYVAEFLNDDSQDPVTKILTLNSKTKDWSKVVLSTLRKDVRERVQDLHDIQEGKARNRKL